MKSYTVLFFIIVFLCLNSYSAIKLQKKSHEVVYASDETQANADKKEEDEFDDDENVTIYDSATKICPDLVKIKSDIDLIAIQIHKLFQAFKAHVRLYQKWITDVNAKEDKEAQINDLAKLKEKEEKYLNNYMALAMQAQNELIPKLKEDINTFDKEYCSSLPQVNEEELTKSVGSAESSTNELIEIIGERLDKL